MKKKYENCVNCGANDYEKHDSSLKCKYCGCEYEIEQERRFGYSPIMPVCCGTVAMGYMEYSKLKY